MVQHVTFVLKPDTTDEPTSHPVKADIWRDDQTIMWGLAEGFSWPNPSEGDPIVPIVFLPADPERGYLAWPGSVPAPIGPRPDPGTPDRRFYTASGGTILDHGDPTEKYHYSFAVCPIDNPSCSIPLDPMATEAPATQQWKDNDGGWHDPEVENQNVP